MSVIIPHEQIPVPEDPAYDDDWLAQENEFCLYQEPLGADGIVYEFWSLIAAQLGLPLITSLYRQGLVLQKSEDFDQLEAELNRLEGYWKSHKLEDANPHSALHDPVNLENHLWERMGYIWEALRVARGNNAILIVS